MDKITIDAMMDLADFLRSTGESMILQANEIEKKAKIHAAKELPNIGNLVAILVEIESIRQQLSKKDSK